MEAVKQLAVACNQQLRAQRNAYRCESKPMRNYGGYVVWKKAEAYWIERGRKLFDQMRVDSQIEPNFWVGGGFD